MPDFENNDLSSIGLIHDIPGYQLPPEAWTLAENVRFVDGGVEKLKGWAQVFGTPGVAPHFAMMVQNLSNSYWLYTSLTKAYVYDSVSHTDITRVVGGDYTATTTRDWNGTTIGGIPILNNYANEPQYWAAYSAGTKLANLPNWIAGQRCKVMRSFGPFLMAFNVAKGATLLPHMVKWSHRAQPGTVPDSWNEADQTKDTGEYELPDALAGQIVDALECRGQMFIYKQGSVWRVRPAYETAYIFAFDKFIETNGLMGPRCVSLTTDGLRHICLMQEDLIIHDTQSYKRILEKKAQRYLFSQIDTTNYENCFVFANPPYDEAYVCYPAVGAINPNRALLVNLREGEVVSELDINFRNAAQGNVSTPDTTTWSGTVLTWDAYSTQWASSSRRKVVLLNTDASKFHQMDLTEQRDGINFTAHVERDGFAFIGKKRDGSPIVNFKQWKMLTRIWIKAEGNQFNVQIGSQLHPDGAITWETAQSFDPATQDYLDFVTSGRAIALRFRSTDNVGWKVHGFKIDYAPLGNF
jgi:hypothetical protein